VTRARRTLAPLLLTSVGLTGCGGVDQPTVVAPATPSLTVTVGLKALQFAWSPVAHADRFRLLEDPAGNSAFTAIEENLSATSTSHTHDIGVHRLVWDRVQCALEACNAAGCTRSAALGLRGQSASAVGYLKASDTTARESFGSATAVSGDGNTVAVGAVGTGAVAGAVYVFVRENGSWRSQARLQGGATEPGDGIGAALALSSDGNTLVVGAPGENGGSRGINGNERSNARANSGAAYVFVRSGGNWTQQAYLKASNADADDAFGTSVATAADGNTVAVGAPYEDGSSRGINGDETSNGGTDSGAVYVFARNGAAWSQQAYFKAFNKDPTDWFGYSVAMSGNGNTLLVGAPGEDSGATGIGGDAENDGTRKAGAAYVYGRNGASWSGPVYVKASTTGASDWFGWKVAISGDSGTFAVASPREDGSSGGIGGDQSTNGRPLSGAVYVFTQSGATWSQTTYIKASSPDSGDQFGSALALNAAGDTLAVGAPGESSNALTIGGNFLDNTASQAGAAYVFRRTGSAWAQQAYVKATNTDAGDLLGSAVALSADGNTLAVGAPGEASSATGIGGNQIDNSRFQAGAAYLY
jgi:trimeric autotransporter adhesin